MAKDIRILIADDHSLIRVGIRKMLEEVSGLDIVGEAEDGEQTIAKVRELEPDVVLLDVRMPKLGGLETAKKLIAKYRKLKIVVLTMCKDDSLSTRLLQAGAAGYVLKNASVEELVEAITTAYAGERGKRFISPEVAQRIAFRHIEPGERPFAQLSKREFEVMTMIVNGVRPVDIADRLALSGKTVNTHRYRIFRKLGINSDVELTLLAAKHGLLSEGN